MRAITYDIKLPRLAFAKVAGALAPRAYVSGLGAVRFRRDVATPRMLGDDWVRLEPRFAGICGSDVMQAFLHAGADNPLSAMVSAPHVMGHEVVGTVREVGARVTRVRVGQRVAVSPWLACAPRGLPACAACARGDYPLCACFLDERRFAKGMHLGNCRDVAGGFAESTALHESMLFPIPDAVSFEDAVLADPFAVALHAVLRAPPEPGHTALVYGCGSLGLLTIGVLAALYPRTTVLAIDHKERLRPLVTRLGASAFFTSRGRALVEQIASHLGEPLRRPFFGLPWIHAGVDRVYDTVGAPDSLEISLRIVRPRASVVMVGVAEPKRFEWTPLYFKEVSLLGSNAYGIEELAGRRAHGIEHFLDLVAAQRLDLAGLVTHRYPLERVSDAFMAALEKRRSGAIKVLFDPAITAPVLAPGASP